MEDRSDWPSLTPTSPPRLLQGTVVVIDLDRFGEYVRSRGLSEYDPNEVTATLSSEVEALSRRWGGVIIYGLDWERGTEEAVIEFPGVDAGELKEDLIAIARRICGLGVSATIVALTGPVGPSRSLDRREAYRGSTWRMRASKIVKRLKRRGGGVVYIDGSVVYTCNPKASGEEGGLHSI